MPPERASLLSFSSPCLTVRNRLLLELFAIFVTAKVSEGWLTAVRMGIGMMPRGEGALIVARVGLQSQIVTQSTYAIVVFMTAVTTLLPPPLLRYLFRTESKEHDERPTVARVQL